MGILRFRNAEKQKIVFGDSNIEFIRSQISSKSLDIVYSNASGQIVNSNEIFYSYLNSSDNGFIEIKSLTNQVLNGSGILNLNMTHRVSSSQINQDILFYFDSSPINLKIYYNSRPKVEDIIKDINNRTTYTFEPSDYQNAYVDFDNDALDKIAIFGNVSEYEVNLNQYIEGDWISINNIDSGLFTYKSLDQDSNYEKDNTWKAMDINGNISDAANIKIKVAGHNIKEASVNSDWETHELNSTLHSYLSNSIDGVSIDKIKIISMSDAISIANDSINVNVGDEILMSDMDLGQVILTFNHSFGNGLLEYQAIGSTIFDVKLTINSIV